MKKFTLTFCISLVVFLALLAFNLPALAWGGRGHHTICEAASFLVKEKALRDYLRSRPHMMGHLCNVPDFYWKSLGGEKNKWGNPTHFVDFEILGIDLEKVPAGFAQIVKRFEGKKNAVKDAKIMSIPLEMGSIWWRADQFYRRAIEAGKLSAKAKAPTNPKEEQDDKLAFNQALFDFFVNLGLMGHFVGDVGQPFHNTVDYDGYDAGHGGIHAYYEDGVVSAQGPELTSMVVRAAELLQAQSSSKNKRDRALVPFLSAGSVIEKMRAMSIVAFPEIKKIYEHDPLTKKSEVRKERGMEIKTAAVRPPAETVAEKYEQLVTLQLARSAALLALLWDQAYEDIGKPPLAVYKSYRYPFTPEFVFPDYHAIPAEDLKQNTK